jgi:hypothetical protein
MEKLCQTWALSSFALYLFLNLKSMSEVQIIQVTTEKQLSDFIKFPMELYKNNQNFVPSLINDEKNIWNPKENPALAYSEAKQFLAYKNDKIVGRIAVMINHKEAKELGIEKVRFGWLDFIDDEEVSKALIDEAIKFAQEKNLKKIEGQWDLPILTKLEC